MFSAQEFNSAVISLLQHEEDTEEETVTSFSTPLKRKSSGDASSSGITPKSAKKRQPSSSKKKVRIEGKTIEQHRRVLGDAVKANIVVEKWCIGARTHAVVDCSLEVYKTLVVPHCDEVVPKQFDEDTPVVIGMLRSSAQAQEIFGVSKIRNGTRMGMWYGDKFDLVFLPSRRELRIWWTMR